MADLNLDYHKIGLGLSPMGTNYKDHTDKPLAGLDYQFELP
jgi:hypothetical protein